MRNYFLISVSSRDYLDKCLEYSIAGLTNSKNGFWAFIDIEEGDYISFLYGARVKNLYRVKKKVAYKDAMNMPPWQPIRFRSGQIYYFPFRLYLQQELELDESMVKPQLSYVAENLLLRAGYRKTHFQADTLTLYNVANMGYPVSKSLSPLNPRENIEFEPHIVFKRNEEEIPEKYLFNELILQSLLRKAIPEILPEVLNKIGWENRPDDFEILGEKGLPEGFVDIFIKPRYPVGPKRKILVEVKKDRAGIKDIEQLMHYIEEFRGEETEGILIGRRFNREAISKAHLSHNITLIEYTLDVNPEESYTFRELLRRITLRIIE